MRLIDAVERGKARLADGAGPDDAELQPMRVA